VRNRNSRGAMRAVLRQRIAKTPIKIVSTHQLSACSIDSASPTISLSLERVPVDDVANTRARFDVIQPAKNQRVRGAALQATKPTQTVATQCRRWAVRGVLVTLALSAANGCIVSGDRCGPHQVLVPERDTICVCEPAAVISADGHGCTPCKPDEEAVNDKCVCKAGTIRSAPGEACKATDIGASCTAASDCQAAFPYCVVGTGDAGYCTAIGCAKNDDCPGGWSCEADGDKRYCHKPPSGLGTACQAPADCAGFDAQHCDTLQSHTCMIGECIDPGRTCPNEWGCCDYSALLGSPLSVCLTADKLVAGACPSGGRLVPR
jgi:hypothetical protein